MRLLRHARATAQIPASSVTKYTFVMLAGALLFLATLQEPEPRAEPQLDGAGLLAGGGAACVIGAAVLATEIESLASYAEPLIPSNLAAIPICVHTVVPGAALRGRSIGRRDRLAGVRKDTAPMLRARLGLSIGGPLITGVAVGGMWLIPYESERSRENARAPLNMMGVSGFAAFTTGLSLIAGARNYEAEFGRGAGIWTPRGAGSLTAAAVLGAGSLMMPIVGARTDLRASGVTLPLLRLTFAATLLGAIGGHLHGQWQREHGESPTMYRRAKATFAAGVTLVTLAPVFGIVWGAVASGTPSPCPQSPSDEDETGPDGLSAFYKEPLTECEKDHRSKLVAPAMLGLASLEIGAMLLGHATAWLSKQRPIVHDQAWSPWMLPGGFGMSWAGRF